MKRRRFEPCKQPGEKNFNAKLTNVQAQQLREEYGAGGITQTDIARKYGISQGAVSQIINGKAYVNGSANDEDTGCAIQPQSASV